MIELLTPEKRVLINYERIKFVEVIELDTALPKKFNIIIYYFDDEGELDLKCSLTEDVMRQFVLKFRNY